MQHSLLRLTLVSLQYVAADGALALVFAHSNMYREACEQPGHAVFRCIAWLPGLEEEQRDEHDTVTPELRAHVSHSTA